MNYDYHDIRPSPSFLCTPLSAWICILDSTPSIIALLSCFAFMYDRASNILRTAMHKYHRNELSLLMSTNPPIIQIIAGSFSGAGLYVQPTSSPRTHFFPSIFSPTHPMYSTVLLPPRNARTSMHQAGHCRSALTSVYSTVLIPDVNGPTTRTTTCTVHHAYLLSFSSAAHALLR